MIAAGPENSTGEASLAPSWVARDPSCAHSATNSPAMTIKASFVSVGTLAPVRTAQICVGSQSTRLRLFGQQSEQGVILPLAVDLDIAPRHTFLPEACFGEQISGGIVGRQTGRFDPVQSERFEYKWYQSADCVGHVTLSCESFTHPIAESAGLRHAAPDIRQRAAAEKSVIKRAKHKKSVGRIKPRFALVALQPAAKGALGQFVSGPGRLPWREEFAAFRAEVRPRHKVLHARIAQKYALTLDDGLLPARE